MNNENIVYEDIINEKSRKYFDKELDVTIIELIDKENELEKVKYLELDDNLFLQNSEYTYQNKTVYIPQYPNGGEAFVSFGLVENMENHEIYHNCCTDKGSSGSPILNIKTQKLLGIHRGYSNKFEMNKGSFLKRTIQEFFQTYNIEKKEEINEIKMKVKIIKGEIGKKIYFLGEIKRDFNRNDYNTPLLNDSNTKLFINEEKNYYRKNFIPEKEGIYEIRLQFAIDVKSCFNMFYNCENIIEIDLSSFNSKSVKSTENMFMGCTNLKNINMTNFETRNICIMRHMFDSCINLEKIDLLQFDTRNVEDMSYMFFNCQSLKDINLSSFNTINVINMSYMFCLCRNAEKINVSSFNTEKVENMEGMFGECKKFKDIDLSSFNTCRNIIMSKFFSNYNTINRIKIKKKFNNEIRNILKKLKNIKVIEVD